MMCMTDTLEKAKQDLAPQWVELSASVREQAVALASEGSPDDARQAFAKQALALCDHVDRIHTDLEDLLHALEEQGKSGKTGGPDEREIDMAAIEVQRETHEMRADPLDILKALLMWRDDPAERVK